MIGDLFDPTALAIGMVALINPCGFALLPAYLGFFLGLNDTDESESRISVLNRAQLVALALTAGFLTVFGLLGVVFTGLYSQIVDYIPWANIVLGIALTILGIAMLGGFSLTVAIPKLDKGTGSRSLGSMYLFGVSYAIASLSCTLPLFIASVGTSAAGTGFAQRLGGFLSYGLGMGLLATVLTLAVALGQRSMVTSFRRLLPWINRISGAVLVVVGIYVALYGVWSQQVLDPDRDVTPWIDSIVVGVEGVQADLTNWINARSSVLGWSFLGVNAALVVAGFVSRRSHPRQPVPAAE